MVDLAGVQPLPEAGEWPLTIPQIEDGWYPTGGPVNPAEDEGIANWQAQLLAIRTNILKNRLDQLNRSATVELTVGPGGQFSTINAALREISGYRLIYGANTAQIRLLAGFVMREQVIASGINMGWVRIIGDDPQTQISRQHLTIPALGTRYPAFLAIDGGVLPAINQLFEMDSTGAGADRDGILLFGAATGVRVGNGYGIKRAGGVGLYARGGATVACGGARFDQAGSHGLWSWTSNVQAENFFAPGCGGYGALAERGGSVSVSSADLTGCAQGGVRAMSGASVCAILASCRTGASDNSTDISVSNGGTVAANSAIGGTSVAPNTVTSSGVIYK